MFCQTELNQHQDYLKRFAFKLTKNEDDAQDLVQNTYLRALEKRELYDAGSNLKKWLGTIMYNLFVSQYRRKAKFESQYDPEPVLRNTAVEGRQENRAQLYAVNKAMKELSPEHREVLILVCIQQYSYAFVAKHLDIPVGTVRSRLARARNSLQKMLDNPLPPAGAAKMPLAHMIDDEKNKKTA